MTYPEHDKLHKIKDQSQVIGEFLEFGLPKLGLVLAVSWGEDDDGREKLWPAHRDIQTMLAEYFDIDLDKIEAEKRHMLGVQRAMNEAAQ